MSTNTPNLSDVYDTEAEVTGQSPASAEAAQKAAEAPEVMKQAVLASFGEAEALLKKVGTYKSSELQYMLRDQGGDFSITFSESSTSESKSILITRGFAGITINQTIPAKDSMDYDDIIVTQTINPAPTKENNRPTAIILPVLTANYTGNVTTINIGDAKNTIDRLKKLVAMITAQEASNEASMNTRVNEQQSDARKAAAAIF